MISILNVRLLVIFILAFFSFIEPNFADEAFGFKGKRKKEQLFFIKAGGLIVVKTYINQKGPFNFILDSGVGLMVITDPVLKDSLRLKSFRKIKISGLGEIEELSAYLVPSLKVNIGNTEAKSLGAAILEKDLLNLSQHAGVPIHGLIGYDFFNSFIIKIYYQAKYLIIQQKTFKPKLKNGYKIPITIEQNKPYCQAKAQLLDTIYPLKLIIDSGAGHTLALESLNGYSFPVPNKHLKTILGVGLGGKINGSIARVNIFNLEGLMFQNLLTSFPHYDDVAAKILTVPRNGSIGNRFLKQFNVIFNYHEGYIYLKKISKNFPDLEHDMSGMDIVAAGDAYNRYIINRIDENSPASDAELLVGDEIIAINFKPTSIMTLDEITEVLRSRNGRGVLLDVVRDKEHHRKIIELKRRI
ncbi:aspartyl protease family protein [Pedobacter glucosidilyticus]|uniref:aspartyl protease family protein n=1 Tax=Pedobacter glucosidilyticus TaxID=1122941 RepID=UPI0026ED99A2|nr:aspartyl protease family protein [Pedobacter glucosidilyticus]